MKKINRFFTIFVLVTSFALVMSCTDDDKDPYGNEIVDGGLVNFAAGDAPIFNVLLLNGQDINGNDFTANLVDTNNNVASYKLDMVATVDGVVRPSVELKTITSFPALLTIEPREIATALGISDPNDLGGGDSFQFEATITTNNGNVYTSDAPTFNTETLELDSGRTEGTVLSSAGYRHAFRFAITYSCALPAPISGDWVFDLVDTYGDGWDGAFITVTIDGVATDYTVAAGGGTVHTVNVPAGTETLSFVYVPGNFEGEHEYTIQAPSGNTVADHGPSPIPGEITLDLCNE